MTQMQYQKYIKSNGNNKNTGVVSIRLVISDKTISVGIVSTLSIERGY